MLVLLWIVVGLIALYLIVSLATFFLAFRRFAGQWNPMKRLTNATDALLAPYHELMDSGMGWLRTHPCEPVEITSYDGLTLRGSFYENPGAKAVLVACHGYRSNGIRDFASACRYYGEHDMSILLIDQRACGRSDGKYITFGIKESRDARSWCEFAGKRNPGLPVVLAGISMGAAAVLMTADDLPECVTALLGDCGYSSAWDELEYVAEHYMARPLTLLVPGVDLWCRLIGGFGLRERDAVQALRKTDRPVFFVHGEADELVPHENAEKIRAACPAPNVLLSVPGAQHGMSYLVDHDLYCRSVDDFLRTFVFGKTE